MTRCYTCIFLLWLFSSSVFAQNTISEGQIIFPLQSEHTHGATVVELPNGDMLAAWFQGNGERWADDVRIMGARLLKGKKQWTEPFLMADVPDFPDVNPVLFIDPRQKLWLVWYTVLANQWETSLPKYRISSDYLQKDGPPVWEWQDVIYAKPGGSTERGIQPGDPFVASVEKQYEAYFQHLIDSRASPEQIEQFVTFRDGILTKVNGENMIRSGRIRNSDGTETSAELGYPISRRIGWQTKNKAVFEGDRMILPLYSDGLEMSLFALTDDYGKTWSYSTPLAGIANIQASVAKKKDGTLVAYMRDNGPPPNRHPVSFSADKGETWSLVTDSELPNPGSGSDIVTLPNGDWVIAYNDTEDGRHSLAVSLSTNEGQSWDYTRHIEWHNPANNITGAYPSIISGTDGDLHIVYSYVTRNAEGNKGESISYLRFDTDWIKHGDLIPFPAFRVGAAVRKITPDPLLPVSGGIGTPRPATEKKGDLFVRAMVMEKNDTRVAVVNIDNLGWPATLGNRSRALVPRIPPENILIGATHTHSGPDAYAFPDEKGNTLADLDYLDWCVQQVADAINEAIDKLEPAALRIAEGEAEGQIAYNYYAPQLYDPRCNVIQAVRAGPVAKGPVIATLVNYAIHPEVLGPKRGILSPDLCGPLYDRIEAKTGGIALFMNGAQGGMVTADNRREDGEAGTWEECIRIGELLADEALRMLEDAETQDDPELICLSEEITFPIESEMLRYILKHSPLQSDLKDDTQISTTLNLVNVGTAQILTIPGEALPNIGYYLKRKMKGKQNMLFGLTNDAFGYILTKEDFKSFRRYEYISRTSLGELTGEIYVNEALKLIERSLSPQNKK